MDAKKVRKFGLLGTLSLALALGVSLAGSLTAGAQGQTLTDSEKADPSHPIVSSIAGNTVTLATSPDSSREVRTDALTVVVKGGKFGGTSLLSIGDKVKVNPSITLPNGMEGSAASTSSGGAQGSDPDKSGDTRSTGGNTAQPGEGSPSTGVPASTADPSNPDKSQDVSSSSSSGQSAVGEGSTANSAANVIWVDASNEKLLGGTVHWAQGDTAVLNIPGVGYSEFVIHTNSNTGYQKETGTALTAASASDLQVGASVIVLGADGGTDNAGFFTAKAILVLPASGKLR